MPPQMLTGQELAQALRVSRKTIQRLIQRGLPHYLVGSHPRFLLVEVVSWLPTPLILPTPVVPLARFSLSETLQVRARSNPQPQPRRQHESKSLSHR